MAAGKLHQRRDAAVDRGMGGEQVGKALARIVDAHFHHRGGRAFAVRRGPSILRSAEIMASGFLVSSTEPASARNSRLRDSAKRITIDSSHATAISAIAMTMAMPPAPPLPVAVAASAAAAPAQAALEQQPEHHFGEEGDHAGDDHRDHQHAHVAVADVGQFVAEHGLDLRDRRDASSRPVVTVIEYCFSFRPLAKALSASSSITLSFGMVMPREMQRFSRRL